MRNNSAIAARMKQWIPYMILLAVIGLVYGNTLLHSFHFDDVPSILKKPWIRGLDKIPMFIFQYNSRPFVLLSFNINYAISQFEVWSYHVVNILIHMGVSMLVYQLGYFMLSLMTDKKRVGGYPFRCMPLSAALIFALHPLNTQSVTYISSRSSTLATFFYLGAMVLCFKGYLGYQKFPDRELSRVKALGIALLGVLSLILGGCSKLIVATFPIMAALFHYFFITSLAPRVWWSQVLKLGSLLGGVLLVGLFIHFVVLEKGFMGTSSSQMHWSAYLLTQTYVIPFEYFWKMLFPLNLNIDIGYPLLSDWTILPNYSGIVVLCLLAFMVFWIKDRVIKFGLAWSLITLAPTSSVIPLLDMAVEHRTYLSLVGFALAGATSLCYLGLVIRSKVPRIIASQSSAMGLFQSGMILILFFYAAGTVDRNAVWKNDITLWRDAKKKSPHLVRPYNNLGEAFDQLKRYDEAIEEFERSLKLDPGYSFALSNLGNIYGKLGRYEKSITYFEKALASKSDYPPAHYNLARALFILGKKEKAKEHYKLAVKYNEYFVEAIFNLAHTESELKDYEESNEHYRQFLEMQPNNEKAWFGLAMNQFKLGQLDEAVQSFQLAIRLNPKYLAPRLNLAALFMQSDRLDEAILAYEKILTEVAGIAGIHKNLGIIYSRQKKDTGKAVYHFKESLRLEPNQSQAPGIRQMLKSLER